MHLTWTGQAQPWLWPGPVPNPCPELGLARPMEGTCFLRVYDYILLYIMFYAFYFSNGASEIHLSFQFGQWIIRNPSYSVYSRQWIIEKSVYPVYLSKGFGVRSSKMECGPLNIRQFRRQIRSHEYHPNMYKVHGIDCSR